MGIREIYNRHYSSKNRVDDLSFKFLRKIFKRFDVNRYDDAINMINGIGKKNSVLDIGCGNGYYMFRMLAKNPELVLGIDPVWHCHAQFHLINHFAHSNPLT